MVVLGLALFLGLLTYLIVVNQKRQKPYAIFTVPTSLAFVLDEAQTFSLDLWLSHQDSFFLTPEAIVSATLTDEDSLDEYRVEPKKLTVEENFIKLSKTKYYPARLTLHFP
ncbi:MAG TPA: hypothetical protein PLK86_01075, partial [Bacilli bacterium]|nr:hypothetical protein [Bacilli bacterium]